ncbi:hypothetical protein ABZ370_40465 [Streptomyces sp. NPDC005962]|uniref:hypothetical protein n=1 Tax=Streptomyces sp. NPDC005962 TaxID=3154466 RepID=UPI00340D59E0
MALDTTWVRLTSHWERADRIVGVRLDRTTTHGTGSRWIHHDARLMVRIKGEDQP